MPSDVAASADRPEDRIRADTLRYTESMVEQLGGLLLEVIRRRTPEIVPLLESRGQITSETRLRVLQAYGIGFQLFNIAEQNAAIRHRRAIESELGSQQVPGSFSAALAHARAVRLDAEAVRDRLRGAQVVPVLTAHPTEAKRVTVLEIHRRIYVLLKELEETRYTERERQRIIDTIRDEIDLLWMTGEIRLTKPTVTEEVAWILHFFDESLYRGARDLFWQLSQALKEHYPDADFETPPLLHFGCWVGGDRDGNPHVTPEVTREALDGYREAALSHLHRQMGEARSRLSIAAHAVTVPAEFLSRLDVMLGGHADADALRARNPQEVFRQYLNLLMRRLEATQKEAPEGYANAAELVDDLKALEKGLRETGCNSIADLLVRPVRLEAQVFGFHTVSLDIRENSTVINNTLAVLYRQMEGEEPPEPNSEAWQEWLKRRLAEPMETLPEFELKDEMAQRTLELFRLLGEIADRRGMEPFGAFILSMTHTPADLLGVYLLAKYGGLFSDLKNCETCRLSVVPLLETIDDLRRGPVLLREMLDVPMVRRSVRAGPGVMEVMVGYSDSNKDGGFLCSNHEVSLAQARMRRVGEERGVPVAFFHGRGGSSSRGGMPAGRAIAAQPPGTIGGRMRLTEQGEVVSGKYANRGYAETQLEILAASVLEHSLPGDENRHPGFEEAMEALSKLSYTAYRKLADHPGLVMFYQDASPVEELALLKIGSRPMRRFGANTLDDLRAIPWVFAWTQNRMMVPGWYGVGDAIEEFIRVRGKAGEKLLREMFEEHRLFRLVIDEVEKTLFQVQLDIARDYAALVPDPEVGAEIFSMIEREYEQTCEAVLRVSGSEALCDRFVMFSDRLSRRLPIIDRVSREQVELIKLCRSQERPETLDLVPLLLSINCVAAGLGWTG